MDDTKDPTKEALGRALTDLLKTTPLSKISVSKLASEANVSRQTFYYHFIDVLDLASWVFETEIADHVLEHAGYEHWARGFEQLLTYMRERRSEAYAVIHSLKPHTLERFMFQQFRIMMRAIMCELRGDLDISEESCCLVVDHFATVVLGYIVRWLAEDMETDPADLVPKLEFLLRGQVRGALEAQAELETRALQHLPERTGRLL